MARISLCMIAKNEEAMLPGCLSSVHGAVDEIILVDTGSTDRTMEIAREHGARVFERPWRDDFSEARNESLAHATGEWILILDADERLSNGGGDALRRALRDPSFYCGMLRCNDATRVDAAPSDVLSGKARIGDASLVPRLLRRTPDLEFRGRVHEDLREWLVRHGMRVKAVDADIVHLGNSAEIRAKKKKTDFYVRLLERELDRDPGDISILGYLANELAESGEDERAWEIVRRGWDHRDRVKPGSYLSMLRLARARALLHMRRGDGEGLVSAMDEAEASEGEHPDLDFFRGYGLQLMALRAASPCAASELWERSLANLGRLPDRFSGRAFAQRYVVGATTWSADVHAGFALLALGRADQAQSAFERALAAKPDSVEAALGRCEALIELGAPADALGLLEPWLTSETGSADAWLLCAAAAERLGLLGEFRMFMQSARERSQSGYLSHHRALRHQELLCALSAYAGRPIAGPGIVGTLSALLAGSPADAAGSVRSIAREPLARFVANMRQSGHARLLGALLSPEAEARLPGVHALARELGVTTA